MQLWSTYMYWQHDMHILLQVIYIPIKEKLSYTIKIELHYILAIKSISPRFQPRRVSEPEWMTKGNSYI